MTGGRDATATLAAGTTASTADRMRALDTDMAAAVPHISAGLAGTAIAYRVAPVAGDPDLTRVCLRALRRNPVAEVFPAFLLAAEPGALEPWTPCELWSVTEQGRLDAGTFESCVRSMLRTGPSRAATSATRWSSCSLTSMRPAAISPADRGG